MIAVNMKALRKIFLRDAEGLPYILQSLAKTTRVKSLQWRFSWLHSETRGEFPSINKNHERPPNPAEKDVSHRILYVSVSYRMAFYIMDILREHH